jgi:hypothetical protein
VEPALMGSSHFGVRAVLATGECDVVSMCTAVALAHIQCEDA